MVSFTSFSLILLKNSNKVIGIHKKDNKDKYSNFIYPLLLIIKNEKQKKQIEKEGEQLEYMKLDFGDEFYIGQSKNGLRHGKGTQYDKSGNIIYEGEFIKDKFFFDYNFCRIIYNNDSIGAGFLCKIPSQDNTQKLPVLITYSKILSGKMLVKDNITIILSFSEDNNKIKIIIDDSRKVYRIDEYQIILIEIKESDNLNINYFLDIEEETLGDNIIDNYLHKQILELKFSLENKIQLNFGIIEKIDINNHLFYFTCHKEPDYLRIPLINPINNKIIGISLGSSIEHKNYGVFMKKIIEDFVDNGNPKDFANNGNFKDFVNNEKLVELIAMMKKSKSIIDESLQKIKGAMPLYHSYLGSISLNEREINDLYDNYQLFCDKIEQYLLALKQLFIGNEERNMNKIYEGIYIIENIIIYKNSEYKNFERNLNELYSNVKIFHLSEEFVLNSLNFVEKNINIILEKINELEEFTPSNLDISGEKIENGDIAFLLTVDFYNFNYLYSIENEISFIIENIIHKYPFFLNYIGFFEKKDSNKKDREYNDITKLHWLDKNGKPQRKRNASFSLKYGENKDLEKILSELLLNPDNGRILKIVILMNNTQDLNRDKEKFLSKDLENNIDFIFINNLDRLLLKNEKTPLKISEYFRDLYIFIDNILFDRYDYVKITDEY